MRWENSDTLTNNVHGEKDDPRFHFSLLKLLFPYIRIHQARIITGFICIIALSLLALPSPLLMRYLIDDVFLKNSTRTFYIILLALILIQLTKTAVSLLNDYVFVSLKQKLITSIKEDLFGKILRLPLSFFDARQTGYVMSRIREASGLDIFFSDTLIRPLIGLFEFIFTVAILFHLSSKLTLIFLSILPLFFFVSKVYSRNFRTISRDVMEKEAQLSKTTQESLSGVEVIKMFTAEERETTKIHAYLESLRRINIRNSIIMSLSSESLSLVSAIGGFVVLWYSGTHIIRGSFTLGTYVAFAAYIAKLYGPTINTATAGLLLQPAIAALNRISEFFNLTGEDDDKKRKIDILNIRESIEFKDVSFAYDRKDVIRNVSFTINKGDKILLVGPNGAGKTTIIKLITGLYHPMSGQILIDGMDINTITLFSLRNRISVVSQNVFLFNDSVLNNVLYSYPVASKERVGEALALSGVVDFHLGQEKIGELGKKLSGGEKQKISIARAILKDSDVIILDEATSHLDADSVKRIGALLKNKFKRKMCIVVSHHGWDQVPINKILSMNNGELTVVIPGGIGDQDRVGK